MPENRRIRHCYHHHHHGPDHAAGDHQRRRLHLPRSLFDTSSTTGAARTRVDREQAAAAHQTAGSATEPKNPALPPPPHGPDHAADDHQRHRFQLPRSLFDPSSTTEAQRAQVDQGRAVTAHQAIEPGHRKCQETAESATATTTTTTAGITPQVTTNSADSSSHGRYSILASPPRLSVLR